MLLDWIELLSRKENYVANHKSADKRARQTKRKTEVNRRILTSFRTFEKKTLKSIEEGKKDDATSLFKIYASGIAKAAKKGIVHKNKAARKISRLSLRLSKLS
jgi:small subunit ribosomal protein S20